MFERDWNADFTMQRQLEVCFHPAVQVAAAAVLFLLQRLSYLLLNPWKGLTDSGMSYVGLQIAEHVIRQHRWRAAGEDGRTILGDDADR